MGSQDRVSVERELVYENSDFEDERHEDMWSLIKPEPRADAFNSLLPANGGKEFKESVVNPSWDSTSSKAFVPVARSRSSLSNDSLQLCTEGLGCESCDCLTESASDESSYDSSSDEEAEEIDCEAKEEKMERDEKIFPPRSFPPPLPSLCASNASFMRSVKKDGRFVLKSVKMPTQNYLHSFREGGRLKMQLVARAEDNFVFPQVSALMKPENEVFKPENETLHEEVDGGGGSDSEETKNCSSDDFSILEKCPEVQESEDFATNPGAVSIPGEEFKGCEVQKQNAVFLDGCKLKGNNNSAAAKSVENLDLCDNDPFPKNSVSHGSVCFNVYNGWRTELAGQNCSNLCYNWQKTVSLPNHPLNKLTYTNNVDLNVNVNESCVHARIQKPRLNDLALLRCHAHKSLSEWGKSQCIATNS